MYEKRGVHDIYYWYDSYGHLSAIKYYTPGDNGVIYYAATNLQGDVVALYGGSGTLRVSYEYDSWGNLISMQDTSGINIGTINPIRYRGYYFDEETGLYYLQSRYYDPQVGRFINADGYISTGTGIMGHNMFAYCGNNPINRVDYTGHFWEELWRAFANELQSAGGTFALAAGVSQLDSPLVGPADILAIVIAGAALIGCAAVAVSTAISATSSISTPKAEEKEEDTTANPPRQPKNQAIFTYNPYDFNPNGLVRVPRAGRKNGIIINWMDPLTNTEVFRWDENCNFPNGPHYHIKNYSKEH